jgi:hypothetical protein
MRAFIAAYTRLFSVREIEDNAKLQWFFGAMLLFFLVTFAQWSTSSFLSAEESYSALCWPYFPDCTQWYLLHSLPYGYSMSMLYMALFAVMLLTVFFIAHKKWAYAHMALLALWIWKFLAIFLLSYSLGGVYDSYHLFLTAALLFVPYKEFFAKLTFVVLYFLSATIKFYPTWTLGTYFTTLELGLPIFPDFLAPLITQSVILEQVVGCWFLLSQNWLRQRLTLAYFVLFHLYGGILVLFNYSLISLPTLLILFGSSYRHQRVPLTRSSIAGWALIVFLFAFQTPVHFIAGDEKYTLEGYRFGMWMFDANHQCRASFTAYAKDGVTWSASSYEAPRDRDCYGKICLASRHVYQEHNQWLETRVYESPNAESRCAPYAYWQSYRYLCTGDVERVSMRQDASINGGPYYRIVDEPDMCSLEYRTFSHNDWIQQPPEAPFVGFARKNTYYAY